MTWLLPSIVAGVLVAGPVIAQPALETPGEGGGALLCGDWKTDPGEECDDGNTLDGDCCAADCQRTDITDRCWKLVGMQRLRSLIRFTTPSKRCRQVFLARGVVNDVIWIGDDETYRLPRNAEITCEEATTVTIPDEVGVVRRTAGGILRLRVRNRGELETAWTECARSPQSIRIRTKLRLADDGTLEGGRRVQRSHAPDGRVTIFYDFVAAPLLGPDPVLPESPAPWIDTDIHCRPR